MNAPNSRPRVWGRVESWLARMFLAILFAMATWGLLELAVGHWKKTPRRTTELITTSAEPYVMFSSLHEPLPPLRKPAGTRRVFVLGGSAVYNGKPPFSELLEARLRSANLGDVEVINLGVIGHVSSQEVVQLCCHVAPREPDLVVMYSGGNDLILPLTLDPRPGYPPNFVLFECNPLLEPLETRIGRRQRAYASWWWLSRRSPLLTALVGQRLNHELVQLDALRQSVQFASDAWIEDLVDTYVTNVWKANRISRAFGAPLLAVFQPLVYLKKDISAGERSLIAGVDAHWIERYFRQPREKILSRLSAIAEAEPLQWADGTTWFDGTQGDVFYDPIHNRQAFMQTIADRLFDEIESRGLLLKSEANSP